jgi:hypothetical protein
MIHDMIPIVNEGYLITCLTAGVYVVCIKGIKNEVVFKDKIEYEDRGCNHVLGYEVD